GDPAADGSPQMDISMFPGGPDNGGHSFQDFLMNMDLADLLLKRKDLLHSQHLFHLLQMLGNAQIFPVYVPFHLLVHVTEIDLHEEPIQLGYGKRIGAFHFHWILGGNGEEHALQGKGLIAHSNLMLRHGLQKGTLDLGRSPVDLIGQQDITEKRSFPEMEIFGPVIEYIGADQVHGQQIRGKLNPLEYQMIPILIPGYTLGKAAGQYGFACPGIILHEYMASGQKAGHYLINMSSLTTDDRFHL